VDKEGMSGRKPYDFELYSFQANFLSGSSWFCNAYLIEVDRKFKIVCIIVIM